jgi:hypothetical protein
MVVRNGITVTESVELGLMNEDHAEITKGLVGNDNVVARPSSEITAGMKVLTIPAP